MIVIVKVKVKVRGITATAIKAYNGQADIYNAVADPERVVGVIEKRHRRAVVASRKCVHRQHIVRMGVQHDEIEGMGVIARKSAKFLPAMNKLVCDLLCQRIRTAHIYT